MLKIGEAEAQAAARVIRSGGLFRYGDAKEGHLSECEKFEQELAEKVGAKHALVVTSGTAALICGLVGLEVGPGDEVIVPGYTFISSALAPLAVGAIPVIAEVDDSLTLDPKDVEAKISRRTKVIMPVHMAGLPANMNAIMRVARRNGVKVLEDACQADGGWYKGRRLGSIADVGAYSFNYYKNVTCGEGGAVVTDDRGSYGRALIHHDGGVGFWRPGDDIGARLFAGWNFRMNEILAAVLRVQLRRIDGLLGRNRRHKARLMEALSEHPKVRFIKHNDLEGECATVLGFRLKDEKGARAFAEALSDEGEYGWLPIDTDRHVYTNWEVIMEERGSYHPGLDAYRRPENRGPKPRYRADMCARTLGILSRTVFLDIRPEWKAADVRKRIRACLRAADAMG